MAKGDDQYTTALEIWDVLTERAIDRETLTFNDLADIIFGKKKGWAVNASLEVGGVFCKERELPHLTVLVVRQGQQKPGKSFWGDWTAWTMNGRGCLPATGIGRSEQLPTNSNRYSTRKRVVAADTRLGCSTPYQSQLSYDFPLCHEIDNPRQLRQNLVNRREVPVAHAPVPRRSQQLPSLHPQLRKSGVSATGRPLRPPADAGDIAPEGRQWVNLVADIPTDRRRPWPESPQNCPITSPPRRPRPW